MKKVLALMLAVLTLLAFTGCGTNTNKSAETTPQAKVEKVRIALVLPATVDDLAWCQSMVEGGRLLTDRKALLIVGYSFTRTVQRKKDVSDYFV